MDMTPAAKSVKAAPRRHSLPVVFLAVRRPASHPCSKTRSVRTAPSARQSHFGNDFDIAMRNPRAAFAGHPGLLLLTLYFAYMRRGGAVERAGAGSAGASV